MRSIITRFSIVNARGGSVSQDIEFLEVEEARKLLFASTMKDSRHLDDDIWKHEFPLDLFNNADPSILSTILYGENGCGKTTFLKLMRDASAFLQSILEICKNRGTADGNDLLDWHHGKIPSKFQSSSNPNNLKFKLLKDNLVYSSIVSAMQEPAKDREIFHKAVGLPLYRAYRSSFSAEMEGVCSHDSFSIPEGQPASSDLKFQLTIRPMRGSAWIGNDRLTSIPNFFGSYYEVRLKLNAFTDTYHADLSESPGSPLLQISKDDSECLPYWSELVVPILVHPNEGILPLGRMVINPEVEVSDEFQYEDHPYETGSGVHEYGSLFKNLILGSAVGDHQELVAGGEIHSPDCEFFRHVSIYHHEGYPSDFFLCPTRAVTDFKTKEILTNLPSLSNKDHWQLWDDIWEGNYGGDFDMENPYRLTEVAFEDLLLGDKSLLQEVVASLDLAYTFSSDHVPKPIVHDEPIIKPFRDRFVTDQAAKYIHLMQILNPPKTAAEGVRDILASAANLSHNLDYQLNMLNEIMKFVKHGEGKKPIKKPWQKLRLGFDGEQEKSDYETASEYYHQKYSRMENFSEGEAMGAAKAEIRNYIQAQLEYVWFYGMPITLNQNKLATINSLLENHLSVTMINPHNNRANLEFSPDTIWSLKSKKKIKFEHLSSGQRNLFSLISILGSEGDGPILIDEPELSLHMDWQLAMKDIVQSLVNHSKRQVFIASHSPDVILKFDDRSFPLLGEEVSDIDA